MQGLIFLVDTDSGSYTSGVLIDIHTAAVNLWYRNEDTTRPIDAAGAQMLVQS